MRSFLALVLAVFVVGLTSLDPFVCADGCTDQPAGHSPASVAPTGDCGFCHGWRAATLSADFAPITHVVSVQPTRIPALGTPHPRSIEHPPRRA